MIKQHVNNDTPIVPRQGLDFGLNDDDIPRHWFGGDAFKTRFFDAMSTLFPDGERFFIYSVRAYRDKITDPVLAEQVKHFIFQEAQHGKAHEEYNDRLARQGIRIDRIMEKYADILRFFKRLPNSFNLGQTAASEHMTAVMAHGFAKTPEILEDADPRIRALYIWHAVEEVEHKAVAYDVMKKVAKISYFTRILSMLFVSIGFPLHVFMIMRHMLKVDGQNTVKTWAKGLWWLYGPRGLYNKLMWHYFRYYLPGYHPWHDGDMTAFQRWQHHYATTNDPLAAANYSLAELTR